MVLKNWIYVLFSLFPLAIIIGNFAINLTLILISISLILITILHKDEFNINNKNSYLLIFFFLSLVLNLVFSKDITLSYPRVVKFFFVIFFVLSFKYLLNTFKENQINYLYRIWSIFFLIIIFDLIFEYFSGKNIFGLISTMPGQRLASFTGGSTIAESESVIGYFFYGFVLFFLSVLSQIFKNSKIDFIVAYILIIISFFIGERSNFIKVFIIINLYLVFTNELSNKIKISFFLILILSMITFLNFNQTYKVRYYNQIIKMFENKKGLLFINNSQYGAHYNVAKEIFLDNPIFGVGIKNFRVESASEKYDILDHPKNNLRVSTHPHQIHYELLSETGLVGYLCFLLFIILSLFYSFNDYLKNKNVFQLSGILFVITSILPLLPSGSFLSTYNSSIFWINYAVMMGYISSNKIK